MRGHREEIDGLRALAIVPVVLFHLGFEGFDGGFVGVDVFFVISGFLIGGKLWSELRETGTMRLGAFFQRRVRRLAPAFVAVALASSLAGWALLLPFEFREFGRELFAATVFLSNVFFWQEAGYFDVLAEHRVLLHTWSLAVEEQFYVLLPLLLLVFSRRSSLLPWILAISCGASFVACVVMTPWSQTTAFYLFPFRAWELLAGVLLAIFGREAGYVWRLNASLSWVGLGLVVASVALLDADNGFPGWVALFPVLGSVLLIANGRQDNLVNRILTTWAFRRVGDVSYSLYLWHWPMVAFAVYLYGDEWTLGFRIVLLFGSIAMAWFSFRFIETPFRQGSLSLRALAMGYALASAALCAAGAFLVVKEGLISRFDPAIRPYIIAARDFYQDVSRCHTPWEGPLAGVFVCPVGPEGPPRLLVWGDSHSRALRNGVEQAAYDADTPTLMVWRLSCPPVAGLTKTDTLNSASEVDACRRHNDIVTAVVAEQNSIKTVLLIARWAFYLEGVGVGRDLKNHVHLQASETANFAGETHLELLEAGLEATRKIATDAGKELIVMRQTPEIIDFSALEAAKDLTFGRVREQQIRETVAVVPRAVLEKRNARFDGLLEKLNLPVIDHWPEFCAETTCSAFKDNIIGFFDNNHVTTTAAVAIRRVFDPAFHSANR